MIYDEDQIIIRKVLAGDKQSFEDLMMKYNRRIYTYIFRMVRNEDTATELTQDFFLKIYGVLNKYNFEYKFSTWSYRICYNLVIDHIRKNSYKIDSLEGDNVNEKRMVDNDNFVQDTSQKNIEKEQLGKQLWEIVENIPEKYKELILLRYIDDLKYEEIAKITELPVGTVKNRIFKAKKILREEMKANDMFE